MPESRFQKGPPLTRIGFPNKIMKKRAHRQIWVKQNEIVPQAKQQEKITEGDQMFVRKAMQ